MQKDLHAHRRKQARRDPLFPEGKARPQWMGDPRDRLDQISSTPLVLGADGPLGPDGDLDPEFGATSTRRREMAAFANWQTENQWGRL